MKIYKEVTIPERKERRVDHRECDLCSRKSDRDDWTSGSYNVNETEIRIEITQKDGSSYPEGGSGQSYDIDLCPTCFKSQLVPWLISQGAKVKREDWDW